MRAFGSKRKQATVADAPPQTGVVGFADSLAGAIDGQSLLDRTPLGKGSYATLSGLGSMVTEVTTADFISPASGDLYYGNELIPEIGSEWGDHIGIEASLYHNSVSEPTTTIHIMALHGLTTSDSPRILFTRQSTGTGVSEILVRMQEDGGTLDTVFQQTGITEQFVRIRFEQKVLSDSQIRFAVELDEVLVMPPETFAFNSVGRSTTVSVRQYADFNNIRIRLYPNSTSGLLSVDSIPKLIL